MRYISWDWFYYVIVGFVLGGGAAYLHAYLRVQANKFKWYETALTVIIFITVLFMAQTFIGSLYEGEERAAWLTLLFMGIPTFVMAFGVFRSYTRRLTSERG
ncbi:hypothetical protein [Vibrio sp. HN007]|uniref:hypothetical protein n=1 Tax=Vibrio iocasae TaxID=3098914 RepID=UPI0035D3E2DA